MRDIEYPQPKNKIRLIGRKQALCCDASSFLRESIVHMEGDNNSFEVGSNTAIYGDECRTVFVWGNGNRIVIGKGCNLRKASFFIRGNNNTIIVGDHCSAYNVNFHIEQDGNEIRVGCGTTFHGRDEQAVRMVADEGSRILIGDDCMFAHSTEMRSTDSHSIVDRQGKRLNPAKDIIIGNHCWVGLRCIILKGTQISPNCVVAAGSVCSKNYEIPHCILAGNPAGIKKQNVDWDRKFISVETGKLG